MTSQTLKLAYITQWFAPEPTAVPVWVARALARQGWEVTVLTGVPNYPDGVVKQGYRAWRPCSEDFEGLRLQRSPLYPSHDASALGRFLNYASFAVSSVFFGRRALKRSDAVLVYSSPATASLAALWANFFYRRPYVLLIQDLWPDSIFAAGFLRNPAVRRIAWPIVSAFVNWSYRKASAVAVIAPGMRRILVDRGVPDDKIHLVYNWADESIFFPAKPTGSLRAKFDIEAQSTVFLYGGNLGAAQGLEPLVDAFASGSDAHLVIVGDGIRKAALRSRVGDSPRVHFHEPVDLRAMTELQADADVLVVCLSDDPLFEITLPSKTQASLAAGRPILAVGRGDIATVVQAARAGIAAVPGDAAAVRGAVEKLALLSSEDRRKLGENASAFYRREMAEEVGSARLSDLLRAAAGMPTSGRGA